MIEQCTIKDVTRVIHEYMPSVLHTEPKYTMPQKDLEWLVFSGIARGDIAGSRWEFLHDMLEQNGTDYLDCGFEEDHRFTDDTAMAFAIYKAAKEIREHGYDDESAVKCYAQNMRETAKKYPHAGYGHMFFTWAVLNEPNVIPSFGNGSAMRAGTIGCVFDDPQEVIRQAFLSALPTHAHPEGVKGAVCTAMAVWMALHNYTKEEIIEYISRHYETTYDGKPYFISPKLEFEELMAKRSLSVRCQETLPEVCMQFRTGRSYDETIRLSYQYMSDTDTVGAIVGGIAAAFYGDANIIANHHGIGEAMADHKNGTKLFPLEKLLPKEMMEEFA